MTAAPRPRRVLFFGAARAGEYESLLAAGFRLSLIRDVSNADAGHRPDGFAQIDEVDLADADHAVVDSLVTAIRTQGPDALITPLDEHLQLGHEVAGRLGLPALSRITVAWARDKSRMRDRLSATLGSRYVGAYARVSALDDALSFADGNGYPVVLKPASLYNSLFVTRCTSESELRSAYWTLETAVPEQSGAREAECLMQIEQYLPGSNHSVDCLSSHTGVWATPVVDVVTGNDIGDPGFYHFSRSVPTQVPAVAAEELQQVAMRATKALGITPGAGHVEMILTPDGPRVVEVAARLGGNRSRLLALGTGIDLPGAYADVLLARHVQVEPSVTAHAAILSLYPSRPGRLRGYCDLDALRAVPTVRRVSTNASSGTYLASPLDGGHAAIGVELVGASAADVQRDVRHIAQVRDSFYDIADLAGAYR